MDLELVDPARRPILADLVQRAAEGLSGRRGGDALLESWLGDRGPTEALSALEEAISPSRLHAYVSVEADAFSVAWVGPHGGWFSLWVDAESRHAGMGPLLAHAAIDWLHRQGIVTIDALALPGDREMKNVLERAGFKARLLTLRRSE